MPNFFGQLAQLAGNAAALWRLRATAGPCAWMLVMPTANVLAMHCARISPVVALAAGPVEPVALPSIAHEGICLGELVAIATVCHSSIVRGRTDSPKCVRVRRDRLQVRRVEAPSVSAQMVDLHPIRNGAYGDHVGRSVNSDIPIFHAINNGVRETSVSVFVQVAIPLPAAVPVAEKGETVPKLHRCLHAPIYSATRHNANTLISIVI